MKKTKEWWNRMHTRILHVLDWYIVDEKDRRYTVKRVSVTGWRSTETVQDMRAVEFGGDWDAARELYLFTRHQAEWYCYVLSREERNVFDPKEQYVFFVERII